MPEKKNSNSRDDDIFASEKLSGKQDEYISYLEMSVQLLQREINHLREQDHPSDEKSSPIPGSGLFNSCSSIAEVISDMHQYILEPYSVTESNIFLFDSGKKLFKAAETETSANLDKQVRYLEEQGIIDWAFEKKGPGVIPNLMHDGGEAPAFFILTPLFIRANPIGVMAARTDREPGSFTKKELSGLASIASAAAAAIDNIKSGSEIQAMNRRLAELNRQMLRSSSYASIWELASAMAEEINAPVKIIEANLNLLSTGIGDKKRRIEIIKEETGKIKKIAEKITNLSGTESSELELKQLNICSLIDDLILLSGSQLQRDGVIIERDYEDTNLEIIAVKPQIEQIILKLLLKARDKMPEGGKITAGVFKYGRDKVMISITDNEPGLSMDDAEKLFDPAGESPDLYLIKNIAEQQGGKLNVWSDIDKGTAFKLIFRANV